MSLIDFNASLVEDFEKITARSKEKYNDTDWRKGMPNPGDMGITAIRYCQMKRMNHFVAMTHGEEMDHSGVSHLHIMMWWFRAEACFTEKASLEALNSE